MTSLAPVTPTTADLAAGVTELLRMRSDRHVISVSPPMRVFGGNARQAWTCAAAWETQGARFEESLILLVRAAGSQVETDPAREFAVLAGLAEQGVRAPRIWAHDPEGKLFGGPAVLLERLPGHTDAVEYLRAEYDLGRARTIDLAVALAELHAAKPPRLDSESDESATTLWRSQFEAARLEPHPTLCWIFDWLDDHEVAPPTPVLVHGDYRPGNVLYEGERIVGILDWELAHIGDPAEDLAWAYRTLWSPQRFVSLHDFVAAYQAAGGREITAESLLWNRVFCEAKFATISLRAARSFADGTSHNLRLIDRARTVIPALSNCLNWITESKGRKPC